MTVPTSRLKLQLNLKKQDIQQSRLLNANQNIQTVFLNRLFFRVCVWFLYLFNIFHFYTISFSLLYVIQIFGEKNFSDGSIQRRIQNRVEHLRLNFLRKQLMAESRKNVSWQMFPLGSKYATGTTLLTIVLLHKGRQVKVLYKRLIVFNFLKVVLLYFFI